MFQSKQRRYRNRSNGRGHRPRDNNSPRPNSFSNGQSRNKFRPTLSPEKLLEKYSTLAKEAMSNGDKTLSENYLQHADHFTRIIEERNKNRFYSKDANTSKTNDVNNNKTNTEEKNSIEHNTINQASELKK